MREKTTSELFEGVRESAKRLGELADRMHTLLGAKVDNARKEIIKSDTIINFTDLLDNYLIVSNELQKARDEYEGYNFDYFHSSLIEREENARNALNKAFEKVRI